MVPPRLIARAAGLLVLMSCSACVPDEGADCPPDASPWVTIGSGAVLWEPLEAGGELSVVQGAQGGFHVPGSLRAGEVDPGTWSQPQVEGNPTVTFLLETESGLRSDYTPQIRPLKVRSDGQIELVGEIVPLPITTMSDAAGQNATFSVHLEDRCGAALDDSVAVLLVPGQVSGR